MISLGLDQHRVHVRGRISISLLIVHVRVVHLVAGKAIHNLMLDARPPHRSDLVKGQFLLQTDQTRREQLVKALGLRMEIRGRWSTQAQSLRQLSTGGLCGPPTQPLAVPPLLLSIRTQLG